MKTRRTEIYLPGAVKHLDMTEGEIQSYIEKRSNELAASFLWDNYPETYTHLVIAVRYGNDRCNIYENGYLMTDDEFYRKIQSRSDIEQVRAYHKGTGAFGLPDPLRATLSSIFA